MTQAIITPVSAEARVALAKQAGEEFSQLDLFSADSKAHIIEALNGVDFSMFEAIAAIWKKAYREDQGETATIAASDTAWSRMCKTFAIEKPRSVSKGATEMSEKREADKTALQALGPDVLAKAKAEAAQLAQTALATADLPTAKKAVAAVEKFDAELLRRHKEAHKGEEDMLTAKRKAISEKLKTANLETLNKVEAVLDLVSSNQVPGKSVTAAAIAPLIALPTDSPPRKRKEIQAATM